MSSRGRIILLVALAAVAVGAFALLQGSGTSSSGGSSPQLVSSAFKVTPDGAVGGVKSINAKAGDSLSIKVTSVNFTGEVHFHGFDIHKDLAPGKSVYFDVTSAQTKDPKVQGSLDMELEQTSTLIARVQVSP